MIAVMQGQQLDLQAVVGGREQDSRSQSSQWESTDCKKRPIVRFVLHDVCTVLSARRQGHGATVAWTPIS